MCGLLPEAATPSSSHHIAVHARVAHAIARDSLMHSPDAHVFHPLRARSRARFACPALPPLGAATSTRSPACCGRARRCRARGNRCRHGADRTVRAGRRAAVGASRTSLVSGGVRALLSCRRAFAPRYFRSFTLYLAWSLSQLKPHFWCESAFAALGHFRRFSTETWVIFAYYMYPRS